VSVVDVAYMLLSPVLLIINNHSDNKCGAGNGEQQAGYCDISSWNPLIDELNLANKHNWIGYIVSLVYVLVGLVFLIPVILLFGCHSKNACAKIKREMCCNEKNGALIEKNTINELKPI
jgi:hypothetical protein